MSLTSIFDHNATTGDHYNIGNENAKAFHSEIGENAKQILGWQKLASIHIVHHESNFLHLKVIRNIILYFLLFEQIYIWSLLNAYNYLISKVIRLITFFLLKFFPLGVHGFQTLAGILVVCDVLEDDMHPASPPPLSRSWGRKQVVAVSERKSGCRSLHAQDAQQKISILFPIARLTPMF